MSASKPCWSPAIRRQASMLSGLRPGSLPGDTALILDTIRRGDQLNADAIFSALKKYTMGQTDTASVTHLKQILVMPVADRCNLACSYCYETGQREPPDKKRMTNALFEQILENTLPYVSTSFGLAFHGGEPLLAGKAFFENAFASLDRLSHPGQVQPIVQTNATLLDKDWCRIFKDNRVSLGISLDGSAEVNDRSRHYLNGKGSYRLVVDAIHRLQDIGLNFGVIVVVDACQAVDEDGAERLLLHLNELGIDSFDVHPAFSMGKNTSVFNVTPALYANFMTSLFDSWLAAGKNKARINFFEHFFQGMCGQQAAACYLAGKCNTILGVNPDGVTLPCTRPFDNEYQFGNLATTPLPDILDGAAYRKFAQHESAGQAQQSDCKWRGLCHGGCPHERQTLGRQDIRGKNVFCTCDTGKSGGYPGIFQHMVDSVTANLSTAYKSAESGLIATDNVQT